MYDLSLSLSLSLFLSLSLESLRASHSLCILFTICQLHDLIYLQPWSASRRRAHTTEDNSKATRLPFLSLNLSFVPFSLDPLHSLPLILIPLFFFFFFLLFALQRPASVASFKDEIVQARLRNKINTD